MADEEIEKKDNKNIRENKIQEQSKLKTNLNWECYKDTGNC